MRLQEIDNPFPLCLNVTREPTLTEGPTHFEKGLS